MGGVSIWWRNHGRGVNQMITIDYMGEANFFSVDRPTLFLNVRLYFWTSNSIFERSTLFFERPTLFLNVQLYFLNIWLYFLNVWLYSWTSNSILERPTLFLNVQLYFFFSFFFAPWQIKYFSRQITFERLAIFWTTLLYFWTG